LRWLRAAYPNAAVVASDIAEDGVAFCAEKFAATPWVSTTDFETLKTSTKFDLIWAGSVITHLPERSASILLNKFISWLNPGGIVVFSSHGRAALGFQVYGPIDYVAGGNRTAAIGGYYRDGYGYADYPNSTGYGVSFIRIDWYWRFFEGLSDVDLVSVTERAWDFHHDVVAVRRV
jgi:SAM-dependent methyltransferase